MSEHDDPRCGTYAGAQAHRKAGTPMCQPCRDAYNAYMREHRSTPDGKRRTREMNKAQSRAVWRLVGRYRDDYDAFYAEELRKIRLEGKA